MSLRRVNSSVELGRVERLLHVKFLSLEDKLNIIEVKLKNTGISSKYVKYGMEMGQNFIRISPVDQDFLGISTSLDVVGVNINVEEGILRFCLPKQMFTNYVMLELVTDHGEIAVFKGFPVIRRSNPYGCFLFYTLEIVNINNKEIINKLAKHSNIDLSSFNILSKSKKIPGRCKLNPEVINLHSDDVIVVHKKLEYFFSLDCSRNVLLFKRFFLDNQDEECLADFVITRYTEWLFEYNKSKSFEVEIKQKKFILFTLFFTFVIKTVNDFLKTVIIQDYLIFTIFSVLIDFLNSSSTYIITYFGTKILLYQLSLKYEHDTFKEQFERLNLLTEGLSFKDTSDLLKSIKTHINKAELMKNSQPLGFDFDFVNDAYLYLKSSFFKKDLNEKIKLLHEKINNGIYPNNELIETVFVTQLRVYFGSTFKKLPVFNVLQETAFVIHLYSDHLELQYSNTSESIPVDVISEIRKYRLPLKVVYFCPLPCKLMFSNLIYLLYFVSPKLYESDYIIKSSYPLTYSNIESDVFSCLQSGSFDHLLKYIATVKKPSNLSLS
eukprot:NODE_615_length_5971_cov_0.202486.p1 type:complete len:551 gc:universal NODE_615_length_5971_cov_0.202486:5125-3473(-)